MKPLWDVFQALECIFYQHPHHSVNDWTEPSEPYSNLWLILPWISICSCLFALTHLTCMWSGSRDLEIPSLQEPLTVRQDILCCVVMVRTQCFTSQPCVQWNHDLTPATNSSWPHVYIPHLYAGESYISFLSFLCFSSSNYNMIIIKALVLQGYSLI